MLHNKPGEGKHAEAEPDKSKFIPPEEIAQQDQIHGPANPEPIDQHQPKKWWHWRPTKKQAVIIGLISIVVTAGVILAIVLWPHKPKPAPKQPAATKAQPVVYYSPLTGLPVDKSVLNRPVTGIMIENSLDARPQSGLDQAGVVFEAVAEGGITRFLALFQDNTPNYVGPVRSARPYYVEWCLSFDCSYAHVGGSPDALADIKAWHVKNLDEFYYAGYYHRISSRYAPHNVYTSLAELNTLENKLGVGPSHFISWPRKPDSPLANPTTTSISLTLSGPYYDVSYVYDHTHNFYVRSEGGQPHQELTKAGQHVSITPKVVIAMVVPKTQGALDSTGAYYSDYAVVGSGPAYIFQDGTVSTGTWNKPSRTSSITFSSTNGQPIKFDAGQTWLTAVGSTSNVKYH